MRAPAAALATLAVVVAAAPAAAHVAPSVDQNNRYLKLTPLGDRVRMVYTVYLGEQPGAAARRDMDRDRDGRLSDGEADTYGQALASRVAANLAVTVDGAAQPVTWSSVLVGLNGDQVAAGSFAVDLVAWICLPTARGHHVVELRDHVEIERAGEFEVRLEESPGVSIDDVRLAGQPVTGGMAGWTGSSGPLATGLRLELTAGERAALPTDGACPIPGTAAAASRRGSPLVAAGAGAVLAVLAAGFVWWRRRRSQSR